MNHENMWLMTVVYRIPWVRAQCTVNVIISQVYWYQCLRLQKTSWAFGYLVRHYLLVSYYHLRLDAVSRTIPNPCLTVYSVSMINNMVKNLTVCDKRLWCDMDNHLHVLFSWQWLRTFGIRTNYRRQAWDVPGSNSTYEADKNTETAHWIGAESGTLGKIILEKTIIWFIRYKIHLSTAVSVEALPTFCSVYLYFSMFLIRMNRKYNNYLFYLIVFFFLFVHC